MRRMFLRLIWLAGIAIPLLSQDHQSGQLKTDRSVVIRSYTKLVQVPVIVTDKSGNPVRGLTQEDFVLTEDGRPVRIASFQGTGHRKVGDAEGTPAQGLNRYSNVAAGKSAEQPVVILVIDAVNTPFLDQVSGRRELVKFLNEHIDPGTRMALGVVTPAGYKVIHEYTTDPAVLSAALNRVTVVGANPQEQVSVVQEAPAKIEPNEIPAAGSEDLLMDFLLGGKEFVSLRRTLIGDMTLTSLQSVAARYSKIPGRKSLIWLASNFPNFADDTTSVNSVDTGGRFLRSLELLNDANVAVYPVDARAILGPTFISMSTQTQAMNPARTSQSIGSNQILGGFGDTAMGKINEVPPALENMKVAADLTGGVAFYGTNDLGGAIHRATSEAEDYYMLGYYLRGDAKPGRRQLKVEVRRPGVRVRSRTRLYVSARMMDPRAELSEALESPLEFTNLPLTVSFDATLRGEAETPFEISLDPQLIELQQPENGLNLTVLVEARDSAGKVLRRIDQSLTGNIKHAQEFLKQPLRYSNRLPPATQAATVRFVVRDNNSGKMGSVIVETQPRP